MSIKAPLLHALPAADAESVRPGLPALDPTKCAEGCRACVEACPVDAISGAAKQMHTIIAPLCTGCELCIAPCPVDCITMQVVPETVDTWKWRYPVTEIRQVA